METSLFGVCLCGIASCKSGTANFSDEPTEVANSLPLAESGTKLQWLLVQTHTGTGPCQHCSAAAAAAIQSDVFVGEHRPITLNLGAY